LEQEERELIKRMKAGGEEAFKEITRRYYRRIYGMIFSLVKNPDDALDLTQEVFAKVFVSIKNFEMNSSFYTWAYKIARNLAIDFLRSGKGFRHASEYDDRLDSTARDSANYPTTAMGSRENPFKKTLDREISGKVAAAMDELPFKLKETLVLREIEGLSYEEMAAVLHIPIGSVMSRLYNARMKMIELLETKYGLKGSDWKS